MTAKGFAHSGIIDTLILLFSFSHAATAGNFPTGLLKTNSGAGTVTRAARLGMSGPYIRGLDPWIVAPGSEASERRRIETDILILPDRYRLPVRNNG